MVKGRVGERLLNEPRKQGRCHAERSEASAEDKQKQIPRADYSNVF
jgi:hypothetical protein